MEELGVAMIPARTPQTKGRMERIWETLQSGLPVEIALNGPLLCGVSYPTPCPYLPAFLKEISYCVWSDIFYKL